MVCAGNKVFKVQADTDRCLGALLGTGSGAEAAGGGREH